MTQPATRGIEATLAALDLSKEDETPEESAQRVADETREERLSDGTTIDDDDFGDGEGDQPLPRVLVPPPAPARSGRGRGKESRSGTKLAKSLADKMPGADKIKVYKRLEGRRHFIQDFTLSDLATFPDAESFITRYIKPKYKSGEYDLVGVDALGRESERGTVRLIDDPAEHASETTGVLQMAERLMQEQRERDREFMQRNLSQQASPLDLLKGVLDVKKELDQETGGAKAESQTMLTMMMAMMQQSQQTMMAILTKPKEEDPLTKLLLTKLIEGGGLGGGGNLPPPPPPPPPPKQEGIAEIIQALAAWQAANAPQGGGDEDYKELVKTLLLQPKQDNLGGLSVKDVIELVKGGGSKNDLQAAVDNMALVMNMAQNLRQSTEPGAAAGFFDALAALFSNRDFAGSIANTIRGKFDQRSATEEERLKAVKQRLDMEARQLERKRQQLLAEAGGSAQASEPPPRQQRQQPPQQTAAPQQSSQQPRQIPPLPANTYQHVNAIVAAKDEADQVGKTIGMLIYYGEYEGPWKNYAERVLGLIRDGQKNDALKFLAPLFESLVQLKLLEVEVAHAVLASFDKHFSVVQEQLAELELSKDKAVTAENLTSPPPAAGGNAGEDETATKTA